MQKGNQNPSETAPYGRLAEARLFRLEKPLRESGGADQAGRGEVTKYNKQVSNWKQLKETKTSINNE